MLSHRNGITWLEWITVILEAKYDEHYGDHHMRFNAAPKNTIHVSIFYNEQSMKAAYLETLVDIHKRRVIRKERTYKHYDNKTLARILINIRET